MDNNNILTEEINRIREIMLGYGVILEASIIGSISDDIVKDVIKQSINTAVKDSIDDVIRQGSKAAADEILQKGSKTLGSKLFGQNMSQDFFDKVVKNLETRIATNGPVRELTQIERTALRSHMMMNKEVQKTVQNSVDNLITTNSQRLGKLAQTTVDDAAKKSVSQATKKSWAYWSKSKDYLNSIYNKFKGKKIPTDKLKELAKKGFLKQKPNGKYTVSVRKLALWAMALGVTYYTVSNWFTSSDVETEKKTGDSGDGTGGSGDGTGGSGGGKTTYTNCTDFPYKKGCSSSVIGEVQKCLGISSDNKFGPGTEKALIKGGYGSEITKEVYDKIKSKCGSNSGTPTPTPTPTFSQGQLYGTEPTPQNFEGGMQSSFMDYSEIE